MCGFPIMLRDDGAIARKVQLSEACHHSAKQLSLRRDYAALARPIDCWVRRTELVDLRRL